MKSSTQLTIDINTWKKAQKRSRRASRVVKTRIALSLILPGILTAFSFLNYGSSGLIAFFIWAAISLPAAVLMDSYQTKRIQAVLKPEAYIELDRERGGVLWSVLDDLCTQMNLDTSKLRTRIILRNYGIGASVLEVGETCFVVVQLGLLKLLETDSRAARAILAHELAHISQQDTQLWILAESYLSCIKKFLMPVAVIGGLIGLTISLYKWGVVSERVNSWFYDQSSVVADQREIMASIVQSLASPLLLIAFAYSVRKLRRRSEELADLAASIFVGPLDLLRALGINSEGMGQPGIFDTHPSLNERTRRISKLMARNQE